MEKKKRMPGRKEEMAWNVKLEMELQREC